MLQSNEFTVYNGGGIGGHRHILLLAALYFSMLSSGCIGQEPWVAPYEHAAGPLGLRVELAIPPGLEPEEVLPAGLGGVEGVHYQDNAYVSPPSMMLVILVDTSWRMPGYYITSAPPKTDWHPDVDLHAYTPDGRHVGKNYTTGGPYPGEYERGVEGALVSGDTPGGGREYISLPGGVEACFVVDPTPLREWMLEVRRRYGLNFTVEDLRVAWQPVFHELVFDAYVRREFEPRTVDLSLWEPTVILVYPDDIRDLFVKVYVRNYSSYHIGREKLKGGPSSPGPGPSSPLIVYVLGYPSPREAEMAYNLSSLDAAVFKGLEVKGFKIGGQEGYMLHGGRFLVYMEGVPEACRDVMGRLIELYGEKSVG